MVDPDTDNNWVVTIESAWQLRESAPHTALKTVNQLRPLVPQQSSYYAQLLIVEAACHWRHFRFVDMMNRLIEAFELLKNGDEYLWMARLQGRFSVGLTSIGDMAGAYRHLHLQLNSASHCANGRQKSDELFTVFHNMGRHFFVRQDYQRADRCYQRCYNYLPEDDITQVLLRQNHAEALARLGKLEKAASEVEGALSLGQHQPANRSMVYAFGVKAWILIAQKREHDAEDTLRYAIDYAVKFNIPSAQLRMKLADLHLSQQQLSQATKDLAPVEKLIIKEGDKHDKASYHKLMSQVMEAMENYKESLLHHKIFHKVQQEILTSEKNTKLQAEELIDRLENIRRQSSLLKLENLALKDTVSRYKSLHEEARELSERDSLTGLYNRRMLESVADNIIKLTASSTASVAVIVVDLDFFKRINDNFGHQTGDRVLKEFAELISATFRAADCLARYGGEEFVLVMPHASAENAKEALHRLRNLVAQHPWHPHGREVKVTFSAGIATTSTHEKFNTLFQKADQALYYAKAMGRDKIFVDGQVPDLSANRLVPDVDLSNHEAIPRD